MNKIRIAIGGLIAGLIAALCVGFVATPPASAGACFTHVSPDHGYNYPFRLIPSLTNTAASFWLYEGQSTCGVWYDIDAVWVQPGQVIVCRYWQGWGWVWIDTFWRNHNEGFGYGVWKIRDYQAPACVSQVA